jgi:Zn-dependent metalloprotease
MKLLYTFFFFSVFSFALQAQIAKPLHPPTTQKTSASKNLTPIKHNLINIPKAKRNLLSSFRPQTLPALTRSLDKASGLQIVQKSKEGRPIMIKGKLKNTPAGRSLSLQTYDYLKAIKKNIQVHHPQKEFVLIEQKTDDLGQVHFKMQQYYKDLKVYGGQIWLHAEKNQIHLFNGRNYPTPNLETSINFQEAAALNIATDAVQKHTKIKALSSLEKKMIGELKKPELVVYHPIGKKEATIAWHLHLYPNISNQWEYFVDANSGEILVRFIMI